MSQRLRIAMLAHSTNPRGGVVHAMSLCEALCALGHDAVLHAPDARGAGFFRTARCQTRAFPVAPAPRDTHAMVEQRIAEYAAFFGEAGNRGFDLYHAHDGISGNALATLKQASLIRAFVRTVHHVDVFADPRLARLQERSIREADALLAVSEASRLDLERGFGIDARIVGNGVDARRYRPETDGGEAELRARLGLGAGPVFLSIGGAEERKNTLRILEAFAAVLSAQPDAQLVIAGGASLLDHGAYRNAFADRLAALGEAGRAVIVTGPVADDDMPRLYRLASALVFASVKEGFGLCALEAMASGIPAVVSRIEPFTGWLAEDEALWCDPSSASSIADAMIRALDDEVAAKLRPQGPLVAARFDWASVARACDPVYSSLEEPAHA